MEAERLLAHYAAVRRLTERLCDPLTTEDYVVQAMPDASPAKWHLAHVSWFFETFVLRPSLPGYRPLDERYAVLFNSYYNGVGPQFSRPARGHLSRPTVDEVYAYRAHVDKAMLALLESPSEPVDAVAAAVELGLNHEQQHQELLVTDVKYNLSVNPLRPAYGAATAGDRSAGIAPIERVPFAGGAVQIGTDGDMFCFDNERPRHRVLLRPYELAERLVTNDEYREFIGDGGYERPELWLSDGWRILQERGWRAPLYWEERAGGDWWAYTLSGMTAIDADAPVAHASYYEADAYARWRGARLPTEQEWEHAAAAETVVGTLLHESPREPAPAAGRGLAQMTGDVWEWTASAYLPYPGFRAFEGALGEYNSKFMVNQMVLRGGSCATPRSHIRTTYRNFFPPDARWQFSGIRLAYGD
jgi:ergothioneine biosynthesis protein EgtB